MKSSNMKPMKNGKPVRGFIVVFVCHTHACKRDKNLKRLRCAEWRASSPEGIRIRIHIPCIRVILNQSSVEISRYSRTVSLIRVLADSCRDLIDHNCQTFSAQLGSGSDTISAPLHGCILGNEVVARNLSSSSLNRSIGDLIRFPCYSIVT